MPMNTFAVSPIGIIHSSLKKPEDAPLFYNEGAPRATLEVFHAYRPGLHRMKTGDEIVIVTWLHLGDRSVLEVHPRGDLRNPLTGVFLTRSPDRPNPVGLHRAKVLKVADGYIEINAIEAIDQTPVIDIKPALDTNDD